MRHFSEQPLADLARGVSPPEISGDIRAHLASGCSKCKTTLGIWSRVEKLAAEEGAYAPPQNLVRLVKLGFGGKAAPQPQPWTLANLVFDSFAQPLPAGVRTSGALSVWQVIYEAEGLSVDLRFGRRLQSKAVHLVGQVLDKQEMRAWQNAIIELLTEYDQVVATAPVSAFGEFHIEFEAKDHLWLLVKTGARNTVRIPLTNPR
jgi:hypothetical protein